MRLVLVGPDPGLSTGGMASVIGSLCTSAELRDAGYSVSYWPSYIDGRPFGRYWFQLRQLFRFVKNIDRGIVYDIHIASYLSAFRKLIYMWLLNARGAKYVAHVHGGTFKRFLLDLPKPVRYLLLRALSRASVVFVLTSELHDYLKENLATDVCVMPNAVDSALFRYKKGDPRRVLFVGRVSVEKGAMDLLAVAKSLFESGFTFELTFIGDNYLDTGVLNGAPPGCRFLGPRNQEAVIREMQDASIFVLPSHFEAFPVVILEAMSAGNAIITTDVGAASEVVLPAGGRVFNVGDRRELFRSLAALLGARESLYAMAEFNRMRIDSCYSQSIVYTEFANKLGSLSL